MAPNNDAAGNPAIAGARSPVLTSDLTAALPLKESPAQVTWKLAQNA